MRLADGVLVQMQQILDRMLELESYNEVVGLLRGIIDDQQKLNERTKQQQTDRIKDLFEDEESPSDEQPSDIMSDDARCDGTHILESTCGGTRVCWRSCVVAACLHGARRRTCRVRYGGRQPRGRRRTCPSIRPGWPIASTGWKR